MPTISCPSCGTRYQVPKPKAGKFVRCKCGVRFDSVTGIPEVVKVQADPSPKPKSKPKHQPLLPPPPAANQASKSRTPLSRAPGVEKLMPPMPCRECGHKMSCEAQACPSCGGPNRWVHPEIARFIDGTKHFKNTPPFEFRHERYSLACIDKGSSTTNQIADFFGGLRIWAPLNLNGIALLAASHFGQQALADSRARAVKVFRVDFKYDPPAFETNDCYHWRELFEFFQLR